MIKVVVADDHPVVRDGLAVLLGLLPDVEVVATAGTGADAVAAVAAHRPDVVLMDLRMPELDGVEAIRWIGREHPRTGVAVLTTYSDQREIAAALRAGALSYLTKDASREDIYQAVAAAAEGRSLLTKRVRESLFDAAPPPEPPDGLTNRELEVLKLVAAGLSNREIVQRLRVSEATVKTHINRIFAKIGARDRAQAVRYAYRRGIASDSQPTG
ncbi:response regulator transcription factor [Nonomuraea aurantiaca]|uniref:response regulator transcription factor n=1 Tax=Nonomuraea aurantiaca TaxID=2878562 RepID=UPI001CD93D51|nr:response regulator transcription factor [Nonomuraea aurantiaca]MCA2229746.1 response regulator transcription factor [Nonomuraea aurantiaca]